VQSGGATAIVQSKTKIFQAVKHGQFLYNIGDIYLLYFLLKFDKNDSTTLKEKVMIPV
jgi:hypothetical protein